MRFVIAAAYSYSLKKGRVVIDKDVDLVESHQYSEGKVATLCHVPHLALPSLI